MEKTSILVYWHRNRIYIFPLPFISNISKRLPSSCLFSTVRFDFTASLLNSLFFLANNLADIVTVVSVICLHVSLATTMATMTNKPKKKRTCHDCISIYLSFADSMSIKICTPFEFQHMFNTFLINT